MQWGHHPIYSTNIPEWTLWRDTYAGGKHFIDKYLKQFSKRESDEDFKNRKEITYLPAFAAADINEIKNSIFQRLSAITRTGGPDSYRKAMAGEEGGVDREGTDMMTFLGEDVLPELLTMSKIGIFVDMPEVVGETLAEQRKSRPYIYTFVAEDILNWTWRNFENRRELSSLLVRAHRYEIDPDTNQPTGAEKSEIRKYWINEAGNVVVKYEDDTVKVLPINRIPCVILELSDSLLKDIARYQVALLNLASSDISYCLLANYPFYTEQDTSFEVASHLKQEGDPREMQVGSTIGRRYKAGMDRPDFIHPSPEPLKASMEKQEAMEMQMRKLVHLAVSNLQAKMASAESKGFDNRGLEAGLSCIGLELQRGERAVAEFWAMYEGSEPATVKYPQKYTLKTDLEMLEEADKLGGQLKNVPSLTGRKEISKKISHIVLSDTVPQETLDKIDSEIDGAKAIINDPVTLRTDLENGVLAPEYAASAQGYPKDSAEKAAQAHAERLARIQESQAKANEQQNAQARGVPDLAGDTGGGKEEKAKAADQTTKGQPTKAGRS